MELLKQSTWEEIIKSGRFHRSTVYRWKKKIEKITGVEKVPNFLEDACFTCESGFKMALLPPL